MLDIPKEYLQQHYKILLNIATMLDLPSFIWVVVSVSGEIRNKDGNN